MKVIAPLAVLTGLALVVDEMFVGNNRLVSKVAVGFEPGRGYFFKHRRPWTFDRIWL
jgi:hypothetical protein